MASFIASSHHTGNTVEYVTSSPRPASSISSEDLDIAQARATELQLASEEAELARVALAAKREAAAAHRRLLQAKARSSRTSRASRASDDRPQELPREHDHHRPDQHRRAEHDHQRGHGHTHQRQEDLIATSTPVLPERPRHPAAGVWDFPMSPDPIDHGLDDGNGREHVRDHVPPRGHGHHHPEQPQRAEHDHPREHDRRHPQDEKNNDVERQLSILKKRIEELEVKKAELNTEASVHVDCGRTQSSGFQTPRQSVDIPLIDLSSPPKKIVKENTPTVSLMDLSAFADHVRVEDAHGVRHRGHHEEEKRPGINLKESRCREDRGEGDRHAHDDGHSRNMTHIFKAPIPGPTEFGTRMDIHPFMMTNMGKNDRDDEDLRHPPGLGSGVNIGARGKAREADEIKLNQLPEVPQFTAWKQQLRSIVMGASGTGRASFDWIMAAENPDVGFAESATTGEYESLDVKLAAAIGKIAKGRIGKILSTLIESEARKGNFVTERQMLRIVYEQYEVDKAKGQIFDLSNLMTLTYPGDEKIESFLDTWNDGPEVDEGPRRGGTSRDSSPAHRELRQDEIGDGDLRTRR